uniref:Uncharacterized protein n=1 Tax=Meloidogyne enterolobii TaxID=390850 RepID=A0A6V7V277_MELEN|nr:unnamed protein product [Meloidogyne enterolobii]
MPFPNKITPSDILLASENDEDINNNTSAIFKFYPSNQLPFSERKKEEKSKKSFNEIGNEEIKQRKEKEDNYLKPKIQIKKFQKQNSDPIPASHRIKTSISEKNKTKGSIKRILIPTPWRNILCMLKTYLEKFLVKELLEKAKNDFKYKWENVKTVRYFFINFNFKMFIKKF